MRPKEMEDLAAFKVREVKRAAAEKETSIPLLKDSESQNKEAKPSQRAF